MIIKKLINTVGIILLTVLFYNCEKDQASEPVDYDEIVWTKSDSPILIDSCFVVPENTVLKIESGVEIKMKASARGTESPDFNYETLNVGMIKVDGRIEAIGSENDSIIFTRQGILGSWGAIFFSKTSHDPNIFKYCSIQYANVITDFIYDSEGYSRGSISLFYSDAVIENCRIASGGSDGIFSYSGKLEVKNCIIENNKKNGILLSFSSGRIENSIFLYNGNDHSKTSNYAGVYCSESNPDITGNEFVNDLSFNSNGYMVSFSQSGDGITCQFSDPAIRDNYFFKNRYGVNCNNYSDAVMSGNKFTENLVSIESGSSSNMIIENNLISGSFIGISTETNSGIINNLIANCEFGITCTNEEEANTKPDIFNNTIIGSKTYGLELYASNFYGSEIDYYPAPRLVNNIIYGSIILDIRCWINYDENPGPEISYCLIGDDSLTFKAQDMGNNIFNRDPLLDTGFKPLPGSPCIDTGNNKLDKLPKTDLSGGKRIIGTSVDIGSYEYGN